MQTIRMRGLRHHHLKNLDLELPRDQFIVITGISGSGKSSLAFDTLYAEGQRRYVESLSAYARQFLSLMEKPDVDSIEGLSPAIAIEQKTTSHHPRSTVGTMTEIYDYLRVLFARVGTPHCPVHQQALKQYSIAQIIQQISHVFLNQKIMILSPLIRHQKGEHRELIKNLRLQGYTRLRCNGQIYDLEELPPLNPRQHHSLDVVIDRIQMDLKHTSRLADSLQTAVLLSKGLVSIAPLDQNQASAEILFSTLFSCPHCGYSLSECEPRLFSFNSPMGACPRCEGIGEHCPSCQGQRLNPSALNVRVGSHHIMDVCALSIDQLCDFFSTESMRSLLSPHQYEIAEKLLIDLQKRTYFLKRVGLNYLSLNRRADSLSGGEAQRIRLASQIGSGLMGVMYILDEPSIGLHARDNQRLIDSLKELRDTGNTIIVIEHDEETIRQADWIVDLGPGAGVHGGFIVAQGPVSSIMDQPDSLTGQYLAQKRQIPLPPLLFNASLHPVEQWLSIHHARRHHLKNIDVRFPLGKISCVTGVSGSGKSTLISDILQVLLAEKLCPCAEHQQAIHDLSGTQLKGFEHLDAMMLLDQSPIGRSPRSNTATYTGLLGPIRDLLAATVQARSRGYTASRFSFNTSGGRCEACEGDGVKRISMHFLSDVYVRCDVCEGKRYNAETLEIFYKDKNIHDILSMTVEDAAEFFKAIPTLSKKIQMLMAVGLGYITLGQSAPTLSGGEAQRIKLAKELSKRDTGKTLYILDEPSTGLHTHDVAKLLEILKTLQGHGNTIIIIEHHLDIIKNADWIVDLGPEGGEAGGYLVVEGTREDLIDCPASYTGQALRHHLSMQTKPNN